MAEEFLRTISLEQLAKREATMVRGLGVMNTTIEENGTNLFPVPLAKAYALEGTEKTVALMDVGLYREMVCDVYASVKIPEAELRLEATQDLIRSKAVARAETLQQLVENGYLTLADYSEAMAPLVQYLPESTGVLKMPGPAEETDEVAILRNTIVERISGLKLKGHRKNLVEALLNSLTPETEYPNHALQLAVYPQPGADGERPKLSSVINSTRPILRSAGVDIITKKAAANSAYRLGLYSGEDEIIGLPQGSVGARTNGEAGALTGKDIGARIGEKIVSAGLAKKQMIIVQGLIGHHSQDDARAKDDWVDESYPGVSEAIGDSRLSSFLPFIREKLEAVGVYIHLTRRGHGAFYYLSENPEPEPKRQELKEGSTRHIGRGGKSSGEQVSEGELSRRAIEDRVREVTVGTVRRSLVDEDDE